MVNLQTNRKNQFLKFIIMIASVTFVGLFSAFVKPYTILTGNSTANHVVSHESTEKKINTEKKVNNYLENEQLKIGTDGSGNIISMHSKKYNNSFNGNIKFAIEKIISDNIKSSYPSQDKFQISFNQNGPDIAINNISKQNPSYFITQFSIKKSSFNSLCINTGKQVLHSVALDDNRYINNDGFISIKDNNQMVWIFAPGEGYCSYSESADKESLVITYKSILNKVHTAKLISGPCTLSFLQSITDKNYESIIDMGFFSYITKGFLIILDYCMHLGSSITGQNNYYGLAVFFAILTILTIVFLYCDVKVDILFEGFAKENTSGDKKSGMKIFIYKAICAAILIIVFFNILLQKILMDNFYFTKMALFGFNDISTIEIGLFPGKFFNFGILQVLTVILYLVGSYDEEKGLMWAAFLVLTLLITKNFSIIGVFFGMLAYLIKKGIEVAIRSNNSNDPYNFVATPIEK